MWRSFVKISFICMVCGRYTYVCLSFGLVYKIISMPFDKSPPPASPPIQLA